MDNFVININDFPQDRTVLFLKEDYRLRLFNKSMEIFGSNKEFLKFFNRKNYNFIETWKNGKITRNSKWITKQGIVLNHIFKLSDYLINKGYKEFNIRNIQRNIISYKFKGKSLLVNNPKLPINIKPELFRIIAHMICDGSALDNNTHYYKNIRKELLEQLRNDLILVFGNVETTLKKEIIIIPSMLMKILSKKYNFRAGTFDSRIPEILFRLPREYSKLFIQAFFDDEGTVSDSNLKFYSFNKYLLNDLRTLILTKFPEFNSISELRQREKTQKSGKKGIEYHFVIGSKDMATYQSLISSSHNIKKKDIDFSIKIKNKKWNHRNKGLTKIMILKFLIEKPKTVKEISRNVFTSKTTVRKHIKGYNNYRKRNCKSLIDLGLIKFDKIGEYNSLVYNITNEGKEYLKKLLNMNMLNKDIRKSLKEELDER